MLYKKILNLMSKIDKELYNTIKDKNVNLEYIITFMEISCSTKKIIANAWDCKWILINNVGNTNINAIKWETGKPLKEQNNKTLKDIFNYLNNSVWL